MSTYRFLATLICSAALALAACDNGPAAAQPSSPIPQRIISVVPSATEMLFEFGLGDRVVAVSDYDEFPPEARVKPRVGGLLNPNIESIIQLKPDFIVTYGSQDSLRDQMRERGIRIYSVTHGSVDETLNSMIELGRAVGVENQAREVEQRIRGAFAEIHAKAPSHPPRVLLVHSRGAGAIGAFFSIGKKAFQSELIEIAGGVNLFHDVDREVMEPTIESIVERQPEIIIETMSSKLTEKEARQRQQDWNALARLPAVMNKHVFIVGENYMLIPGPRMDLAARKFAEIIHAVH